LSDASDKKMKLETAIVVTVLILLFVTFAPILLARLQTRPEPVLRETYSAKTVDATTVLKKVLHQTPDAAEYTDEEITTYVGGASSRSVVLEVVEQSMPLAAADITRETVRFVGDGSYDVVKTGGLIHDEFQIEPTSSGKSDVLGYEGNDARKFLNARSNVRGNLSRFRYVRIRSPNETMRSHDLSQASTPVVPEICKHAPVQAISMSFEAGPTGSGGVSVFVVPQKNDLPPVAFHVRFYGKDLLIKYHVLKSAVGLQPNAIVTMSASATTRTGGETFLIDARTGTDNVTVYAELTKGHVRVCTEETARKRSYYTKLPLMFSEDNIFQSDSVDPPKVFTRTYDVEQSMIVPFAVGDLGAFDRVQAIASKRIVKAPPYKPTNPRTSKSDLVFRHPNGKQMRRDGDKIRLNNGTEVTITLERPAGLYGANSGFVALYDGSKYLRHAGYVMWSHGMGSSFDWAWKFIEVSPGNYNIYNDFKDGRKTDDYYLGYDSSDDRLRIVKLGDSRMVTWSINPIPDVN
jgi:hypothetical protein